MKEIESVKNERIKNLKKLEKKKYRDSEALYLLEGEHLVEEAIKFNADIKWLLVEKSEFSNYQYLIDKLSDEKIILVTSEVIKYLSTLPSPQPIIAVVHKSNERNHETATNHCLLLENVQDPGNVGTMIRTADAAGFSSVILGEGTADVYSPKVVRSMQGSQFHIQIQEQNLIEKIQELKNQGYMVYGTELNEAAIPYHEIKKHDKIAIVMGNEGQGVSEEVLLETDCNVYITMRGRAESLNVAVAAGILMFFV